jgi:hypothetical protein
MFVFRFAFLHFARKVIQGKKKLAGMSKMLVFLVT